MCAACCPAGWLVCGCISSIKALYLPIGGWAGAYGTLGVGAGFALGAKLVHPDADVWLLWGDGSVGERRWRQGGVIGTTHTHTHIHIGFSVAEFDTLKRHGIPVIAVVGACAARIGRTRCEGRARP
jgi:hypothetical protein